MEKKDFNLLEPRPFPGKKIIGNIKQTKWTCHSTSFLSPLLALFLSYFPLTCQPRHPNQPNYTHLQAQLQLIPCSSSALHISLSNTPNFARLFFCIHVRLSSIHDLPDFLLSTLPASDLPSSPASPWTYLPSVPDHMLCFRISGIRFPGLWLL